VRIQNGNIVAFGRPRSRKEIERLQKTRSNVKSKDLTPYTGVPNFVNLLDQVNSTPPLAPPSGPYSVRRNGLTDDQISSVFPSRARGHVPSTCQPNEKKQPSAFSTQRLRQPTDKPECSFSPHITVTQISLRRERIAGGLLFPVRLLRYL
jgi:hypothetical protein